MLTHPRGAVVAALLGALTLSAALGVTPFYTSHDRPPGAAVRFWWARLGPVTYATYALSQAPVVMIHDPPSYCPDPESLARAWLTLTLQPDADARFRRLLSQPQPAARLYALLGLAAIDSRMVPEAIAVIRRDSSLVWLGIARLPTTFWDTTMALADAATVTQIRSWSRAMLHLSTWCAA